MFKKYLRSRGERWLDGIEQDEKLENTTPLVQFDEVNAEDVTPPPSISTSFNTSEILTDIDKPIEIPKHCVHRSAAMNKKKVFVHKTADDEEESGDIQDNAIPNDITETYNVDSTLLTEAVDIQGRDGNNYTIFEENLDEALPLSEWAQLNNINTGNCNLNANTLPSYKISNDDGKYITKPTIVALDTPETTIEGNASMSSVTMTTMSSNAITDSTSKSHNNATTLFDEHKMNVDECSETTDDRTDSPNLFDTCILLSDNHMDKVQDGPANVIMEPLGTTNGNNNDDKTGSQSTVDEGEEALKNYDCHLGDVIWAQIYNYCYWPCIVSPEPITNTFLKGPGGINRTTSVHVRFFADKGSRNWVKSINILPFDGYESYLNVLEETKRIYGVRSVKLKSYVPVKHKQNKWFQAVAEAEFVRNFPMDNRISQFNALQHISKEKEFEYHANQDENQPFRELFEIFEDESNSPTITDYTKCIQVLLLDIYKQFKPAVLSCYPGRKRKIDDFIETGTQESDNNKKRLRTESTTYTSSDWDDDLISEAQTMYNSKEDHGQENNESLETSQENNLFANEQFIKFYNAIKDCVMPIEYGEAADRNFASIICKSARHLWAIKYIYAQIQENIEKERVNETGYGSSSFIRDDKLIKRMSNRLKGLQLLQPSHKKSSKNKSAEMLADDEETADDGGDASQIGDVPSNMETSLMKGQKRKKVRYNNIRVMEELFDNIFSLDRKYLFKGLSKSAICRYCLQSDKRLLKCANRCPHWLHVECLPSTAETEESAKISDKQIDARDSVGVRSDRSSSRDSEKLELMTIQVPDDLLDEQISRSSIQSNDSVFCHDCKTIDNVDARKCMVCNESGPKNHRSVSPMTEMVTYDLTAYSDNYYPDLLLECKMPNCHRLLHPKCCRYWPQAKLNISKRKIELVRCPSHVCHTCVSDDPKRKYQHLTLSQIVRCIQCPATYHRDSMCIPAGSELLTASFMICPRHNFLKSDMTVNVNWCFICVGGGNLVCCETCPIAAHAKCLKLPQDRDELYICEECESGRLPLYGEMIWVKFKSFRWWPALTIPPALVPLNIFNLPHKSSDFVVLFYGSHNYSWMPRRRVYLYLEGDSSKQPPVKKSLDVAYNRALKEAQEAYVIYQKKKQEHALNSVNKLILQPQPYVRIRSNRAVPPFTFHYDMDKTTKCDCDPMSEHPCGPDSDCWNRVLYHECNPKICPAGMRCENRMFESRISPRLEVVDVKERGFGLICREPIRAGTFIIEYVGEAINADEFKERLTQKLRSRDENFYFLTVEKDYVIDAGPKGNLARFMNHSCDPNCQTQKWIVNSVKRIGVFALKDIPENTELTFNYHWDDLLGTEKVCYCGSRNCSGQLGGGTGTSGNSIFMEVLNNIQNDETMQRSKNYAMTRISVRGRQQGNKVKRNKSHEEAVSDVTAIEGKKKLFKIKLPPYTRRKKAIRGRKKKFTNA